MKYETLSFEIESKVGIILLLEPLQGMAALELLADEVSDICGEMQETGAIRVLLIGDVRSDLFPATVEALSAGQVKKGYTRLIGAVGRFDQPVVVGISGDSIGVSLEFALACDLRIAAMGSHFGLPHVRDGLIPFAGGTQRLSRLVGKGKALEMILTGDTIDAQEALRIGLVNRVVPKEEVMKLAMDMAKEMAMKGPIAIRYAKEAVLKGMDMTLEQGLRLEADLYLLTHTTKDRTEGITAFREKKRPQFEGK